jgi:catechol 2,3-dioxygenase-like lactoylglutathione lyase family enzyme
VNIENRLPEDINPKGKSFGKFSGEILPVFYVSDVLTSVAFYRDKLGFNFQHYWDYSKNKPVYEWIDDEPPVYAQMRAGTLKFALHLYGSGENLSTNGMLHYFEVQDINEHYLQVKERGIELSPLIDRPWMRMFSVCDPDGHRIFFFTRPSSWIY